MRIFRTVAVIAGTFCAALGLAAMGAGAASAATVTPIPGGIQVDLTHADTVWVQQNGLGRTFAGLPIETVASFGQALDGASSAAVQLPAGRVAFTAEGPITNLGGLMVVLSQ